MTHPPSCRSCKYYTNSVLLPCTVHPLGPISDTCGDLEPRWTADLDIPTELPDVQAFVNMAATVDRAAAAFRSAVERTSISIAEASARMTEGLQRLSLSLPQESLWEAYQRLASSPFPEPEDPEAEIIRLLALRFHLKRDIAAFRFRQFADRHSHLTPSSIYQCLCDGRIRFKFGYLVPGKNFPKQPNPRSRQTPKSDRIS